MLTDQKATVPPIVKTVYLLRRKSCAQFGLNFSNRHIFTLSGENPTADEKNTQQLFYADILVVLGYSLEIHTNEYQIYMYYTLITSKYQFVAEQFHEYCV